MKLISSKRRMAVVGLTVALIAGAGGLAFAYFTSSGNGTGSAQVGTASPVLINQIGGTPLYNSRIDASAYQWSQCYYCTQMGQLGSRIQFATSGASLSDVQVDMANFGATSGTTNLTFNIYGVGSGNTPGALLATDTQSFNIPAAPDGGAGSTYCKTGPGSTNPYCGIGNFTVTFDFASQNITLPSQVVYGLQYPDAQNAVNGGLNVQLSYESSDVSVGSDVDPGQLFTSLADGTNGYAWTSSYNDVGPGEITCSDVGNDFKEFVSTSSTSSSCGFGLGTSVQLIPAVEFDATGTSDLFPAGPSQPINFTVNNPGSSSAEVQQVTIAVAQDGSGNVETIPGDTASAVAGCQASWFTINGSPVTLNQNVAPGATITWTGAASISMSNPQVSQDACQGVSVGLTFSSN